MLFAFEYAPETTFEVIGHDDTFGSEEESMAISDSQIPGIIVSASGMATGGRILHHLKRRLPDPRNTVVLTGFQADGTRGRSLSEGARYVKIHGRYVPVNAQIEQIDGFSAHADRSELLSWMGSFETPVSFRCLSTSMTLRS